MISTIFLLLHGFSDNIYAKPIVKNELVGTKVTIKISDDLYWKTKIEQERSDNFIRAGNIQFKTWIEKDF